MPARQTRRWARSPALGEDLYKGHGDGGMGDDKADTTSSKLPADPPKRPNSLGEVRVRLPRVIADCDSS